MGSDQIVDQGQKKQAFKIDQRKESLLARPFEKLVLKDDEAQQSDVEERAGAKGGQRLQHPGGMLHICGKADQHQDQNQKDKICEHLILVVRLFLRSGLDKEGLSCIETPLDELFNLACLLPKFLLSLFWIFVEGVAEQFQLI